MIRIKSVRWIFVHTLQYGPAAGIEAVRRWHTNPKPLEGGGFYYLNRRYPERSHLPERVRHAVGNGWDEAGYHGLVRRDGTFEEGRGREWAGAHVAGVNTLSWGIACEGDGRSEPLTPPQRVTLLATLHDWMKEEMVPVDNILGHYEVNRLIDADVVADHYRTQKSCPGRMIDMEEIRSALMQPHMVDSVEDGIGLI